MRTDARTPDIPLIQEDLLTLAETLCHDGDRDAVAVVLVQVDQLRQGGC